MILILAAAAAAIFILSDTPLKKFKFLDTDVFQLSYGVEGILEKEEEENYPVGQKRIAAGVFLIIAGAVPLIIAGALDASDTILLYTVGVLLLLVAVGVTMIVYANIQADAYKRLLQKEQFSIKEKERNHTMRTRNVTGIYWTCVTAVYLLISFLTFRWDITWIIWPAAVVLSGLLRYVFPGSKTER